MNQDRTASLIFTTLAGCCIVGAIVFSVAELTFPTIALSFLSLFFIAAGFLTARKIQKEAERSLTARASFVSPANLAIRDALQAFDAYREGQQNFSTQEQLTALREECLRTALEMVTSLQDIPVSSKALALASLQACREQIQKDRDTPSDGEESLVSAELEKLIFHLLENIKVLSDEKHPAE